MTQGELVRFILKEFGMDDEAIEQQIIKAREKSGPLYARQEFEEIPEDKLLTMTVLLSRCLTMIMVASPEEREEMQKMSAAAVKERTQAN